MSASLRPLTQRVGASGHSRQLRGGVPRVAGEDHSPLVNDDRADEANRLDRLGEVADLALRMGAGALRIGPQRVQGAHDDVIPGRIVRGQGGHSLPKAWPRRFLLGRHVIHSTERMSVEWIARNGARAPRHLNPRILLLLGPGWPRSARNQCCWRA